jgi:glycosyltransferase involved in cell wall biosynthesis
MRIALILHYELDINAGAAGAVISLSDEYKRLGHDVTLISMNNIYSRLQRYPKFQQLIAKDEFKLADPIFPLFCAGYFFRNLRKYDVVDASSCDAWLYGSLSRSRFDPLLVSHSHGLEHTLHLADLESERQDGIPLTWKYPLYRGSLKLLASARSFRVADLALYLNSEERDYAIRYLGVAAERARVVPNGLPARLLGRELKPCAGSGQARFRIAQIASYLPRKGIAYGAAALNRFLLRHPRAEVLFLGTSCPADRVLADFRPDLHDRIQVVPRFDRLELPQLLEGCSVKLFPTLAEGFGLGLLEAMACGLAPIATATGGPLDIVTHEVDGLVVPPRDADAIELALQRLIDDPVLLDRLRRNAHRRAQEFDWARIAAARLGLYEEFLERKRSGVGRSLRGIAPATGAAWAKSGPTARDG